ILGVGNGDPSCHEPDTMIATPNFVELGGWKMKRVDGEPTGREEVKPDFDDSGWETAQTRTNQLRQPGETAIFRTTFNVDDPVLRTTLGVGPIDDLGWVYVNGELVGTTNQWDATHQFSVAGKLNKGKNVLAIVVRNNGGEGGLTRGVKLSGPDIQPKWSRSLFHGLGQVILNVDKDNWKLRATSEGLTPAEVGRR
ncbi:MAG TPA: beta galactosidase jelly roll domain-containing protein, partial [Fimbriimonadaceae bacterium]|nr:beta galactosidase jelly roll domain-containing protein [Fimbriimonadaceae bacterium]